MASKTKSSTKSKSSTKASKSAASKSAPKKAKSNGQPKKVQPRAARKSASGKTKTVPVARIKNPKWQKAAKLATALVQRGSDGSVLARAPISTPKVEMVATLIGRRKASDVLTKSIGFKTVKQAEQYAGAHIGRTDLPDGVGSALSALASDPKIGDPKVHKINGRAMAAVLVALSR